MSRCIVIGAGELAPDFLLDFSLREDDFVICADGGFAHAQKAGICPDLLMGDQDSFPQGFPDEYEKLVCRPEKDDSDMMLAVKEGIARGYSDFVLLGATGGRFDHTLANLQTIAYGLDHNAFIIIADRYNMITMLRNGTVEMPRMEGYYLSVFSYGEQCRGVSLSGVKYPLADYTLTNTFPLGLSNEILADTATVTVKEGTLVVVVAKDRSR